MRGVIFICAIILSSICHSQIHDYGKSIELRPKAGFLIAHRASMNHLVKSHFYSGEIAFNFHTDGSKYWHKAYNYPTFGILGTFTYNGNSDVIGQAIGIGACVKLPFINRNKWSFNSRLAGGFAYLTRKFDIIDNPKNNSIGSHLNLLVILGIDVQYQFEKGFINFGIDFTHYSNSGTVKPNLGLNIPSLVLGYGFKTKRETLKDPEYEEVNKKWTLLVHSVFSVNQNYNYQTRVYPVFGINTYLNKRFGEKSGISTGIDLIYNEANRHFKTSPTNQTVIQTFQVGAFTSYDLQVNRFVFQLGMGAYLYNPYNPNGWLYHKLGGRVNLNKGYYINATVKTHWAKADYFELGLGYQFKLNRK